MNENRKATQQRQKPCIVPSHVRGNVRSNVQCGLIFARKEVRLD
jgi:hypothetical protein